MLMVLCALTLPALPIAAQAAPARSAAATPRLQATVRAPGGGATIIIGSISPKVAAPRARVTVSGWVRNDTRAALRDLQVQLWSSGSGFTERAQFGAYLSGLYAADRRISGATVGLPATIWGGQTVRWHTSFRTGLVGMRAFGVYPLAAALFDATGTQISVERSFLPFWPGRRAISHPLNIAWIWPLIDQPHRGICAAMLDNGLAANLAGGRLAALLDTGLGYDASAKLTWAVDPALLDDAHAMAQPYRVLTGGQCSQSKPAPASAAARDWLAKLRTANTTQPAFTTPYADPDVAALTHRGLDTDLRTARRDGLAVAATFLDTPDTAIAWPPGGIADAGVLDNIVAAAGSVRSGSVQGGIRTVVLDNSMMPPTNPALYYTPDAITAAHTGLGTTVRLVLADDELTNLLANSAASAHSAAPGAPAAGAVTAASQLFLAETAMIAAEAPNWTTSPRSVVVAPPRRWNPGAALASQLLADTITAPWMRPAYLAALKPAVIPPGVPAPDLGPLPANQVSGELTRRYLGRVRDVEMRAQLFQSILTSPTPAFQTAVSRLESSAWRGGETYGRSLIRQADAYISGQERMVAIIPSSAVALGGNRGTVPVSIGNRLPLAVQVRLQATVSATRAVPAAPRMTLASLPATLITIGPYLKETIRLQVRAHSAGLAEIHLRLLNPQGVPLPGSDRILKVRSTAFGTLALVIIAIALAVLVLTAAARIVRRATRDPRPGTVVAEGNATDDDGLPEAADELADARGAPKPDTRHEESV